MADDDSNKPSTPSSSDTPPPQPSASSNSDDSTKNPPTPPPATSSSVPPPRSKSLLRRWRSLPRLPSESFDSMTMDAESPLQIAASIKGKEVATTFSSSSSKGKADHHVCKLCINRGRSACSYNVQPSYTQQLSRWPYDLFPGNAAAQSSSHDQNQINNEITEVARSESEYLNFSDEWLEIFREPSTPFRFPKPVQDLCKGFSLSIGVLFVGYLAYFAGRYPYKDRFD